MTKKMRKALSQLDSSNDDHWTEEGLPRLNIISNFFGNNVSREMVTDAAKGFCRTNTSLDESVPSDADSTADVSVTSKKVIESDDLEADPTSKDDAIIQAELEAAHKNVKEANGRLHKANAAMDEVISRREKASDGRTAAHNIKYYLKIKQEERVSKINRAKEIAEIISKLPQ